MREKGMDEEGVEEIKLFEGRGGGKSKSYSQVLTTSRETVIRPHNA